jgi:hypothetical protein
LQELKLHDVPGGPVIVASAALIEDPGGVRIADLRLPARYAGFDCGERQKESAEDHDRPRQPVPSHGEVEAMLFYGSESWWYRARNGARLLGGDPCGKEDEERDQTSASKATRGCSLNALAS